MKQHCAEVPDKRDAYSVIVTRVASGGDGTSPPRSDLDTAAKVLRQRAAIDDADRADVRKSYRLRLLQGVSLHLVVLTLLAFPAVIKLSALLSRSRDANSLSWTWGFLHNVITAEQALAINGSAFGAAVAISAALAIVAALTGRRAVEDALWRRNVQRVIAGAALTTTVVVVLLCIGGIQRTLGSILGASVAAAGTCLLAVTTLTHTNQTVRAENYRHLERRLTQLLPWRADLHDKEGVPRSYAGPGAAPYKNPARTALVALCFGGASALTGLLPLISFHLHTSGLPLSRTLLLFLLSLASASVVAAAFILLIAPQHWTTFPPQPHARKANRTFFFLTSLAFGLGAVAFTVAPTARGTASMFITWFAAIQLAVAALFWSRRPNHPRWIDFLTWPTWARVNATLAKLHEHYAQTAANQLLEEAVSMRKPPEIRRRSWDLIRAVWNGEVIVKVSGDREP